MSDLGINAGAIRTVTPTVPALEQVLILGWNWRTFAAGEAEIARHCMETTKQAITFQQGDTTDRRTLDGLPSAR